MERHHQFPCSEPLQLLFLLPKMLFQQTYLTFLIVALATLYVFFLPYFSSKVLLHPNHHVYAALFLFHKH